MLLHFIYNLSLCIYSYDEYIKSSKEVEKEYEIILQDEILKYNDLNTKYNLLLEKNDQYMKLNNRYCTENTQLCDEVLQLKNKLVATIAKKCTFEIDNDKLLNDIRMLQETIDKHEEKYIEKEEENIYLLYEMEQFKDREKNLFEKMNNLEIELNIKTTELQELQTVKDVCQYEDKCVNTDIYELNNTIQNSPSHCGDIASNPLHAHSKTDICNYNTSSNYEMGTNHLSSCNQLKNKEEKNCCNIM